MNIFELSLLFYIFLCIFLIKYINLTVIYIGLSILILANIILYFLRNPTEALLPYNILIENLYEKKVFYSEKEKKEIFPTSEILETNWEKIRNEFLLNVDNMNKKNVGENFIQESEEFWKGWTTFELKMFDKNNEENMKKCPLLSSLIKKDPNISTAFFSILEPGKIIPSHYGPFKGILRYHLGLKIPKGNCFISVDNEIYDWKEGEGVLFDETYKHFVKNETSDTRVILFLDVRRPLFFPLSILNEFLLYIMSISPYNL